MSKFNLTLSSTGAGIPVNVTLPVLKAPCGFYDAPVVQDNPNGKSLTTSEDGMPIILSSVFDSIRLDSLVLLGLHKMEIYDSLGNDLEAIKVFNDIFKSGLSKSDSVANYWLNFSLDHMKTAVENSFSNKVLLKENNISTFEKNVSMYVNALM